MIAFRDNPEAENYFQIPTSFHHLLGPTYYINIDLLFSICSFQSQLQKDNLRLKCNLTQTI